MAKMENNRAAINTAIAGQARRLNKSENNAVLDLLRTGDRTTLTTPDVKSKEKAAVQKELQRLYTKRDQMDKADSKKLVGKKDPLNDQEREILRRTAKKGDKASIERLKQDNSVKTLENRKKKQNAFAQKDESVKTEEKRIHELSKKAKQQFVDGKITQEQLNARLAAHKELLKNLGENKVALSKEKTSENRAVALNTKKDSMLPKEDQKHLRSLQGKFSAITEEMRDLQKRNKELLTAVKDTNPNISAAAKKEFSNNIEKIQGLREDRSDIRAEANDVRRKGSTVVTKEKEGKVATGRMYTSTSAKDRHEA